jgi:hypothetical protein
MSFIESAARRDEMPRTIKALFEDLVDLAEEERESKQFRELFMMRRGVNDVLTNPLLATTFEGQLCCGASKITRGFFLERR